MGPANSSISIMQNPPTKDRDIWGIIDEIVHFNHVPHKVIVFELLRKMQFWCKFTGISYRFHHISDAAAFDQINTDGTYDGRRLEEMAKALTALGRSRQAAEVLGRLEALKGAR